MVQYYLLVYEYICIKYMHPAGFWKHLFLFQQHTPFIISVEDRTSGTYLDYNSVLYIDYIANTVLWFSLLPK
jgi:hypothetical protein